MDSIYFDNAATTKMSNEALSVYNEINEKYFSNASSSHFAGFEVENKIKNETEKLCEILKCDLNEIVWTSGGTESNNFVIRSVCEMNKKNGNHIITSKIEHPSVKNVFKYLENNGFEVSYIDVDNNGFIDLNELKNSLNFNTIFVSFIHVNNEIGVIQNIGEISSIIKNYNKNIFFHIDAVQSFLKINFIPKNVGVDSMSVSCHKFHAPKGVGFLYIDKKYKLLPLIFGGGQQNNLRSGTINTPGICSSIKAIECIYENFDFYLKHLMSLRDYLIDKLEDLNNKYGDIFIITKSNDNFAPHIVSVAIGGIRAEVLLHILDEKKIYVSSGSACSSKNKRISETITNIHLNNNYIDNVIRISFSKYSTTEEIDALIKELIDIIPKYRRFNK